MQNVLPAGVLDTATKIGEAPKQTFVYNRGIHARRDFGVGKIANRPSPCLARRERIHTTSTSEVTTGRSPATGSI